MDTYQPIYDAVRSRISNGNIAEAVIEAIRPTLNIQYSLDCVVSNISLAAENVRSEMQRPFVLLRPRMFPEGNQWCALYGDNIHDGVCAFGDTPAQAAIQFDIEWLNAKTTQGAGKWGS
jgi:hypothetical protein